MGETRSSGGGCEKYIKSLGKKTFRVGAIWTT